MRTETTAASPSRCCDASAPAPLQAVCAAWQEHGGVPAQSAEMLEILAPLDADPETLAAALWYDLACRVPAAWQDAAARQSDVLRRLVDGQQAAAKVFSLHADAPAHEHTEGLRRLLLAMVRDLRVVFILLARQLAELRAAARLAEPARLALARQTADLHAPLANRLGIWQVKWELEDLAFRYREPDTYKRIAHLLDERRDDREQWIKVARAQLEVALREAGVRAEVVGRPKHIYSIWKKMQRKEVGFSDLYDIRALRVMVDDVPACYAALGVVHQLWAPVPSEFDDYIARPKPNGYRSLHTAVIGPQGRALEVQIRTAEMHRAAELGVAAHWRYKEGGGGDTAFEARIAWMRSLLENRSEDDGALVEAFRTDLLEERIYVLTPKGEVMDLPRGASVLDFAYHVHTEVGHRCRGAKVNGRIVPLTHQPGSGDRIEILTGKLAQPSRDWLSPQHGYLHTGRAREKVRAWFRRVEHTANLEAGRVVLEREMRRLALPALNLDLLPSRLALQTQDELFEALALGEVGPGQLARALHELHAPPAAPAAPVPRAPGAPRVRGAPGALTIEGVGNLLLQLARCCQPLPGDAVLGYVTRGRGVSVHRADCPSLARLRAREPERIIQVAWGQAPAAAYQADIVVLGYERKDLLKDVTSAITQSGVSILASSSQRLADSGEMHMRYSLRVRDFAQLGQLLARLSALPNVREARRLAAG
ncbi:RelA/SpoT family protein [Metallibacterium scheffleri]|uniref:GTP pyrophosphokinase n=1 Tax=Metallibacterium scheffleri TaxID=993689 RepID=A0A4S3KM18_9GAMM|nr:bifunctional (p)ppGpp synthetase/guanosine-3',5'-bis(diphosphate) 3'-pyrophosphohydrolase [Metallibacterium scheffleri]THD09114.1 GTP diphosphokinase [Metallibacterium scheffleri]